MNRAGQDIRTRTGQSGTAGSDSRALIPVVSRKETRTIPRKNVESRASVAKTPRVRRIVERFDYPRNDGSTIPALETWRPNLGKPFEPIQPDVAHPPATGLLLR